MYVHLYTCFLHRENVMVCCMYYQILNHKGCLQLTLIYYSPADLVSRQQYNIYTRYHTALITEALHTDDDCHHLSLYSGWIVGL